MIEMIATVIQRKGETVEAVAFGSGLSASVEIKPERDVSASRTHVWKVGEDGSGGETLDAAIKVAKDMAVEFLSVKIAARREIDSFFAAYFYGESPED